MSAGPIATADTGRDKAPIDFGDADLSRAWLVEATHGPIATNSTDEWILAPLPDGTWSLWLVR